MYSNLTYVTFIFYLYSFFFYSLRSRFVLQTEIYRANIIHHFILLSSFFTVSITLPAVRISAVLNLKSGSQDFTDPGLLKIRRTLTGLSLWFCFHKCLRSSCVPRDVPRGKIINLLSRGALRLASLGNMRALLVAYCRPSNSHGLTVRIKV